MSTTMLTLWMYYMILLQLEQQRKRAFRKRKVAKGSTAMVVQLFFGGTKIKKKDQD